MEALGSEGADRSLGPCRTQRKRDGNQTVRPLSASQAKAIGRPSGRITLEGAMEDHP